jgi:DNA-binding PadR family transcriptional regulator
VEELSESALSTGPGNIYGSIQRLEEAGLIHEAGEMEGRRRRLYALTPRGRDVLRAESGRLARLADLLRAKGLAPGSV